MAITHLDTGTVTHAGAVVSIKQWHRWETEHRAAVVWTGETLEDVSLSAWHDGGAGSTWAEATIDATPETQAAVKAYQAALDAKIRADAMARDAVVPKVGRTVKVVKGRKIPVGTVGVVRWAGLDQFRRRYYMPAGYVRNDIERVGIAVAGRAQLLFTDASNVEVVQA